MTKSIANINSGVDYATGNALPAATVNSLRDNALVAHTIAAAKWSQSIISTGFSAAFLPLPVWDGEVLHMGCADPFENYYSLEILPGGAVSYRAVTGLPTATGLTIGYNSLSGTFDAMANSTATATLYVSSDRTFASWSTVELTTPTITATAYYARPSSSTSRFFCGASSGGDGFIIAIGASSIVGSFTNANTTDLTSIIGNGASSNERLVAVGLGGVSYSADSGATWTHIALTFPTGATGYPCVVWDASRSLYVLSTILDTGELAWTTSATGATWQAWRKAVTLSIPTAIWGAESAGIAVVGSTWLAPYVHGTSVTTATVGVMFSIDGGASWRPVVGTESMTSYSQLRCVAAGNRYAIVGQRGAIFGPDVVASELVASVST